jgi:predicted ATP-binding protein involved in virulence
LKAISIHIEDTKEKFSLFDEELERIELFRSLINERFLQKVVVIDPTEGICIESTETGFDIPLEKLSSGEQHLLVLYYDMIFRFPKGTLVLIDEPEISLHVSWQKRFISEMKKIMKINGMKAIIATHSPTLIGRYWGLTRELDKNIGKEDNGVEG